LEIRVTETQKHELTMLEIVLDKQFINKFFQAYQGEEEYVDDFCKYFIRNLRKFTLISNYAGFDDLRDEAARYPLLEQIIERTPKVEFLPDLDSRIDSTEFPCSGSPFKLILSGDNNERCIKRRRRFGLEFLNPENLSDRWRIHYSRRPDIFKKTTHDTDVSDDHRFDSWDCLHTFRHPLNAIIMIDFYLLKWRNEKELQHNVKNNIVPLLTNLLKEASMNTLVEITVISEFNDTPPQSQKQRVQTSLATITKELKNHISAPFSLNILVHKKSNYPPQFQEFHDRLIITSYFYITIGAGFSVVDESGFNIFNQNGRIQRIKKNTEIMFRSILNIQNIDSAYLDLKNLEIYSRNLENHSGLPDYLNFFPSKSNRLLNITHANT
jgi:hypothetical protein